ncbi:unnamed protein product [Mytilus edulis]|uniref:Uncharacterized protein n=1 Tax=Mytilus edulis TaxID=6550 RepID=A0A8S3V724_MYTED|nr:unnamed protein product [Mytilus edulis]
MTRGLTRYDNNTCFDKASDDYRCCSDYEEINGECIKCILGFISRKGNSCEPCATNLFGKGCLQTCRCNELQGLSKTELLILFCGALSGIIVLLGYLGIAIFVKKRMRMSKSKRDKATDEGAHLSEEQDMQEAVALHDSLYEIIDDSHIKSILVPQPCNCNIQYDDESQSIESSANCNDDRSNYLDPVSSPITKKLSFRKEKQRKTKSICLQNQMACSPYLENDGESPSSKSSANCNDDRSIYLQPLSTSLIKNDSSCHTEEQRRKVFPSANNSPLQTSCDPILAIVEDISDASDVSNSEFSEDATPDRSSYMHPYNTLFHKTSSCHIYEVCQNEPFLE